LFAAGPLHAKPDSIGGGGDSVDGGDGDARASLSKPSVDEARTPTAAAPGFDSALTERSSPLSRWLQHRLRRTRFFDARPSLDVNRRNDPAIKGALHFNRPVIAGKGNFLRPLSA
jgi:hypothetical protein